jgi:hypothetical protein
MAMLVAFAVMVGAAWWLIVSNKHRVRTPLHDGARQLVVASESKASGKEFGRASEIPSGAGTHPQNIKTGEAPNQIQNNAPSSIPPEAILTSELRNRGNATAIAAAETFLWATMNGETDALAKLIRWTFSRPFDLAPGSPYVATSRFSEVPEPWRSEAKTAERLVAWMHQNELQNYGAYRLEQREVVDSTGEIERVTFRLFGADGSQREETLLLQRTQFGWQRVHWPQLIDKLAKQLKETPPPRK